MFSFLLGDLVGTEPAKTDTVETDGQTDGRTDGLPGGIAARGARALSRHRHLQRPRHNREGT